MGRRITVMGLAATYLVVGASLGSVYASTSKDGQHPIGWLAGALLCFVLALFASRRIAS